MGGLHVPEKMVIIMVVLCRRQSDLEKSQSFDSHPDNADVLVLKSRERKRFHEDGSVNILLQIALHNILELVYLWAYTKITCRYAVLLRDVH